uniref:RT_RNaseH domain-containing protein n=1 Tax=Steinernema glaseri TaxID=37863 RepID=A0A1I7YN94_9BILA
MRNLSEIRLTLLQDRYIALKRTLYSIEADHFQAPDKLSAPLAILTASNNPRVGCCGVIRRAEGAYKKNQKVAVCTERGGLQAVRQWTPSLGAFLPSFLGSSGGVLCPVPLCHPLFFSTLFLNVAPRVVRWEVVVLRDWSSSRFLKPFPRTSPEALREKQKEGSSD